MKEEEEGIWSPTIIPAPDVAPTYNRVHSHRNPPLGHSLELYRRSRRNHGCEEDQRGEQVYDGPSGPSGPSGRRRWGPLGVRRFHPKLVGHCRIRHVLIILVGRKCDTNVQVSWMPPTCAATLPPTLDN